MMQPFASDLDANFLGWINRLARIDRHRTQVDGACYLANLHPALAIEHGRQATLQWGSRVVQGPVTDVARVTITPWDDDAVVEVNPRTGTSRRKDMLTGSFREECDTRGSGRQPVRATRPAEQWSAPVAPTRTTLERINTDAKQMLQPPHAG